MIIELNIDFALLRSQKEMLLAVIAEQPAQYANPLEGVVFLIDAIQDQAVDSGEFSESDVFGPSE